MKSITAYVFDKYSGSWEGCRNITAFLAPSYWRGHLEIKPVQFDLLDSKIFPNQQMIDAICTSNIFVMQNCLNDQPGTKNNFEKQDRILRNLISMIETAPNDSLFIFADVPFTRVRNLYKSIEREIQNKKIATPLSVVPDNCHTITSNIQFPPLLDELFTGEDRLVPKKHTDYFSTVFRKYT